MIRCPPLGSASGGAHRRAGIARRATPPPSAGVAGRMLREPAHDVRHLLLEAPGYGDVEDARALRGPVLEVVRHAAGREDERPRWASTQRSPSRMLMVPSIT